MDTASLLANERRARLAAERLLDMRQRELKLVNRKLSDHARMLTTQVMEKRKEMDSIQSQTESLRDEYVQTRDDLARANTQAELAQGRLWSALQSVRDGFAVFDGDHRLVVANKAYLTVFDGLECVRPGITFHEIIQILVEEGIVDTQGPPAAWLDLMTQRWAQEQPEPLVLRLWNGQFIKLMDRRTPEGGTVTLGVNQTDQLRMWAAVEAIPDGFVLYDQEDRMVMCNQRYREIYGDSAEAMVPGATFEEILRFGLENGQYQDALGREEQWLEERLADHRQASRALEQPLSDGKWLRIVEKATPDGGRVGLRVDISEIKEQQTALEAERERAEAANRAKSAFLANMSHEIRTPMNGVVGMADMLSGSGLTQEQSLYVDTIKSSGEALLTILNDILDFSKIEATGVDLLAVPFNLEDCLHHVVGLMTPSIAGRAIRLSLAFDPAQPVMVMGDAGRVRQILTNLVGNGLKFTNDGEVAITVQPGPDNGVRITVQDTGIGIPEDKLDHIFGEFNQVEDDRNRSYDGTGLGLAICRQLATQMGGTIGVTSTLGKGSRFIIDLPLPPADDQEASGLLQRDLAQSVVQGPEGAARTALAMRLGQLGLNVRQVNTMSGSLGADTVAFMFADSADVAAPQFTTKPKAVILVTSEVGGKTAPPAGFDRHIAWPMSRTGLVDLLNGLTGGRESAPKVAGRLRVLAAEDNKTNRLVLEKMLKSADIDLNLVTNGAEAVQAFMDDSPDLVFMDISMPGMDGREATRRIRAFEAEQGLPHTPIIAMTAHDMPSDKVEIAEAGIDHHLSKPLNRAALLDHIKAVRPSGQESG